MTTGASLLADDVGLGKTEQVVCTDCHRPLTDPISRAVGRGPDCRRERDHGRRRGRAQHIPGRRRPGVGAGQDEIPGLEEEGET